MTAESGRARPGVPLVKTAVPGLSRHHVPRARLLAALDEAVPEQVTLVSAPAGYGKTQLLAEWVARRPEQVAWVSLDDDDTDDRRFWSAVLAALVECTAVPASSALHDLAVPARPSRDPEFVAAVVDAVAAVPGPVRLVLDDVHELTAPAPLHGLAALVRDRPPSLRLVLSGRTDPPLPLSKMRLAGQLCEVRAGLLRFSVPETAQMLSAADIPARPDQVRLLVEQTEGWAAGLRLAALSLRESVDPDQFLTDLVGNGRAVSDYLFGEILSRLPMTTRDLLGAVSICARISAPLAGALTGRSDAGEVLDSLERETGLVLSTGAGRTWYRLHPLLRSHLRADLQRRRPDLVVRLHARAADWFAEAGQPGTALTYARRGGAPDRVQRLLREHATTLIADGEHEAVRAALEWLGAPLRGDPVLALVAALVATESGAVAEADDHVALADAAWPADPAPELVALRGLVRARRTILAGNADATTAVVGPDAAEGLGLAPMAMLHLAAERLGTGRRDEARGVVESALEQARRQHHGYLAALALTLLAAIAAGEGDYRRMAALAEAADAEPDNPGWQATVGALWASTTRAYAALLRCEPDRCLQLVSDGAGASRPSQGSDEVRALRTALAGAALFDLGRTAEGVDRLHEAHLLAAGAVGPPEIAASVAVLEHGAATALGRGDFARGALGWAEEELGAAGELVLLRARQRAAHGRYRPASDALAPLWDGTVTPVLPWTLVEARVLECSVALRLDQRARARRELDHALALCAGMDVVRPLACGPAEVVDLLVRHVGSFGNQEDLAARVLTAQRGRAASPVALTDRERAVLSLLPTQRSFEEIADDLTVSRSTVKSHVRAIYSKFGVSSRREAVARARRHGILSADPR